MRTLITFYSNVTRALIQHVTHQRIIVLVNADYQSGSADLFGSNPDRLVPKHVDRDADEPVPWYEEISKLIQEERDAGNDVEVDLTAGKKSMSLGAYAAAEFHSARSTYLKHVVPGPRREPSSPPEFEIIGSANVVSIRDELGLDWLTSADNAFKLGRFDAASELYAHAAEAKAPGADVLVELSNARQAWLDGQYVIAEATWPSKAGSLPQPWGSVANSLSASPGQDPKQPFEFPPTPFALWLQDRRFALHLRRDGGHALTDVAREAWLLIEEISKASIRAWMLKQADLRRGQQSCGAEKLADFTLGRLLHLICTGSAGDWQLVGLSRHEKEPILTLCDALRGRHLPSIGGRRRFEGLEVRNGLAHGSAKPAEVHKWVSSALAQHGPLDQLIHACMPPGVNAPAPSPLEDPAQIRRKLSA